MLCTLLTLNTEYWEPLLYGDGENEIYDPNWLKAMLCCPYPIYILCTLGLTLIGHLVRGCGASSTRDTVLTLSYGILAKCRHVIRVSIWSNEQIGRHRACNNIGFIIKIITF